LDHLSMERKSVLLVIFLCCQVFTATSHLCHVVPTMVPTTDPALIICGEPFDLILHFTSNCNATPSGTFDIFTPSGVKAVTLVASSTANTTFDSTAILLAQIITAPATYFVDFGDDGENNEAGYLFQESPSSGAPLVFNWTQLQTINNDTIINIGYQYLVADSGILANLHLSFASSVTVLYSCSNNGNDLVHESTLIVPQAGNLITSVNSTLSPDVTQAWQYSFTLPAPASICSTIHIRNIQITVGITSNQNINITVQTQFSIPGVQAGSGHGNANPAGPNLNLNDDCVVNSLPDPQCSLPQFTSVAQFSSLRACSGV